MYYVPLGERSTTENLFLYCTEKYSRIEKDVYGKRTTKLSPCRNYRNSIRSRSHAAASSGSYPRVKVEFALTPANLFSTPPDRPLDGLQDLYDDNEDSNRSKFEYHTPEEEIAMAPACWLWDYLRCEGTSL